MEGDGVGGVGMDGSDRVEQLDKSSPRIVHLQCISKVELLKDGRYGSYISSRDLKATDADTKDEEIIFHILRPPSFGYLENTTKGDFIRQRFTQKDLNRRHILYVINPSLEALSDSLEVLISDPTGNTGIPETLELKWSRIEFSQSEYVVCEDVGTLSLPITREGYAMDSSFIGIKVNEISASEGKDFTISPSSLIQFDPGVSARTWNIGITSDRLEEAEEVFEVVLNSPVNTVLGSKTKLVVKIIDSKKGQCSNSRNTGQVPAIPQLRGQLTPVSAEYPPPSHGVIQVEKIPLTPVEGTGWTRGDIPQEYEPPPPRKRLRVIGNGKTVRPSYAAQNGTDAVFTYHGIMSLRVEDDTSTSSSGKKAKVLVTRRGQQRHPVGSPRSTELLHADRAAAHSTKQDDYSRSFPKPCTPDLKGLLHFDQSAQKLFDCDGISWKPWKPTNDDISANKCPPGWTYHGTHCYYISTDHKSTWNSAARACKEIHRGNLVSVLSKPDMMWLWDFSGRKPFWIGLNDRVKAGKWEWLGGEPVSFTNWRKGPPRASRKAAKNCVVLTRTISHGWTLRNHHRRNITASDIENRLRQVRSAGVTAMDLTDMSINEDLELKLKQAIETVMNQTQNNNNEDSRHTFARIPLSGSWPQELSLDGGPGRGIRETMNYAAITTILAVHENCEKVVLKNSLSFGRCSSIHVPRNKDHTYTSCSYCVPTKFTSKTVELNCKGSVSVTKLVILVEVSVRGTERPTSTAGASLGIFTNQAEVD
ncbi:FREM1 protein, partial [Polyodon spathula]|nr:FREM1 protein [Polyodon spathula]